MNGYQLQAGSSGFVMGDMGLHRCIVTSSPVMWYRLSSFKIL